ncbi:PH domain-containing protein [Candidatus Gracilibacteria bacterium]|nr:PH domain-containing protein [Candidatus Gracilibacteria bacterium]
MTLHRHWIILVFHFFSLFSLIASSIVLLAYQTSIVEIVGSAVYWGGISIYWIIFLTFILILWINDELDLFIITDTRVIGIEQISVLSRTVTEFSLDRVQEVNAHTAGIIQTLFGYGDVHIHTASDTSNIIVKYAPDPIESARKINNIIQEHRMHHMVKRAE